MCDQGRLIQFVLRCALVIIMSLIKQLEIFCGAIKYKIVKADEK